MKKKKKSERPRAPAEPIKPVEYHEFHHDLVDFCCEYEVLNLEGLIKKLPKGFDASSLRFEKVEACGDSYSNGSHYFNVEYVEKKKNDKYEQECQKYEKALATYAKQLTQYGIDLKEYEAWQKKAELRGLKNRIKELEKKETT